MTRISSFIRLDGEYSHFVETVATELKAKNPLPVIINGLSGGALDAFMAEAAFDAVRVCGSAVLIILESDAECIKYATSLSSLGLRAYPFRSRDFVFHNISASHDTERERLSVLLSILSGEVDVILTTLSGALGFTIPPMLLEEKAVSLSVGDEISPLSLADKLLGLGFARVDMVEGAGQFSLRGGIVDLWCELNSSPVRVEFFGDEIDRMVYFDPTTQRSSEQADRLSLLPATEVLVGKEERARIISEIDKLIKKAPSSESLEYLKAERAAAEAGLSLEFRDKYLGTIYRERANLLSYITLSSRTVCFIFGTNECREQLSRRLDALNSDRKELISAGLVSEAAAAYSADEGAFNSFLENNLSIHVNSFAGGVGTLRTSGLFGFRCRRTISYGGNPSLLVDDVKGFRKAGYRTLILTENRQGADSLVSSLASADIAANPIYSLDDFDITSAEGGRVFVGVGQSDGFELIVPKIAVLSMARPEGRVIMENRRRKRILKKVGGAGARLMSYADLSVGDYVVHANYGIGLFEGIEAVTVDGVTKDYITIRYAGTDKLFVPCDRLEMIGKYIGERDESGKVKLSKMGGGDWNRTKSRAKSAARDIAKNLIQLYAERQRQPGFAFPADSELEDEFAAGFEYEETESQLVAIEEIKRDMMRPVPMNRLLCGDVGFGKTEVALRAAFKAIMGGKQVAILVPTTILALQHYQTALTRMRSFPVSVEMISRFRTPKEQELILRKTKRGEVDILIGTHKLLSKKVEFRDLGLLIIDEEQRFGVAQKEKLKEMAKNVDCLTLSATPIPRTLNMAMNGISDMSILDEAPGDRHPVQTYVLEYDEVIIFDAMRKELLRGGQVLYLYNRVEDIDLVADKIVRALPDARVAVAHGGMDREELEDIWQSLVNAEIDILVCTTIIETGVDLPGANTLIIENADRMGLSQLHQIRGRVGRSERQAYAYFTFRKGKALSDIAQKRLNAIREFAKFGAGFKVALRDLEIRGAGNLLGAEQHGYIESVGYDLYIKLLSEAVLEESGRAEEKFESSVEMNISANIPERYIPVNAQRMEMYKKISLINDKSDMSDVTDEFIDRYGEPPKETMALLKISLIRATASNCEIRKVEFSGGVLSFVQEKPNLAVWSELFGKHKGLTFRAGTAVPTVIYRIRGAESAVDTALSIILDYHRVLCEIKSEEV